jgi:hypothetical protein
MRLAQIEVGVGEYDERRVAAEFEGDFFHCRADTCCAQFLADFR